MTSVANFKRCDMSAKRIEYVTSWLTDGTKLEQYLPKILTSALRVQQTLIVDEDVHL